jgi:hypothetical protein
MLIEREDYTTPALHKLTEGLNLSQRVVDKLKSFRKDGAVLGKMCEALGSAVLTALPYQSTPADALHLPFSTDLQREIKPSDYHKLCGKQLDFFLIWLPKIFPNKLAENADMLKSIIANMSVSQDWQVFTQESFDLLPPKPKRQKRS